MGLRLQAAVPAGHLLGRYGGEEFAAILSGTESHTAGVAEHLRHSMSASAIETSAGPVRLTVSVGLAHVAIAGIAELDALMSRADAALYRAKEGGRNRVVVAEA